MLTRLFSMGRYGPFAIISSLLLSACVDHSAPPATDIAATTSHSDSAVIEGDSAVGSPGKRRSPITIGYQVLDVAAVGEPLTITLYFDSKTVDGDFEIHYRSSAPQQLALAPSQPETMQFGPDADGNYAPQTVVLLPQENGRFYLQVSAGLQTQSGLVMRPYSIPVQVGPSSANNTKQKTNNPGDAEQGISIPARMN